MRHHNSGMTDLMPQDLAPQDLAPQDLASQDSAPACIQTERTSLEELVLLAGLSTVHAEPHHPYIQSAPALSAYSLLLDSALFRCC